jgi:hypothetical protein
MTQTPEEWAIAAMAERKPGIEIAPLRPAALKPYQEAYFRELLAEESEIVTVMVPSNGGYTYQRGVDAYMAKLSVDRLKEMAAQIDTADEAARAGGDIASKDMPPSYEAAAEVVEYVGTLGHLFGGRDMRFLVDPERLPIGAKLYLKNSGEAA